MRAEKVSVIPREECCSGYESGKVSIIPRAEWSSGYGRVKSKRDTQRRML